MLRLLFVVYLIGFFSISILAHADDNPGQVSIYTEKYSDSNTLGISVTNTTTYENPIYVGLSLNRIASTKALAEYNRKILYPVYLFLGVKPDWFISPFIEGAFDFGDLLIKNLDEENNKEEDDFESKVLVDTYFSAGLELNYKLFSASIYYKEYDLRFWKEASPSINTKNKNILKMIGLRFSYIF